MTPSRHARPFALLLLAVALLASAQPGPASARAASPRAALYTAQDLGTFGRNDSTAFGVSDNGEMVVGSSHVAMSMGAVGTRSSGPGLMAPETSAP